jgi:Ser/Thr protein kinase RdoA (MazF antagonist)
MMPSEPLPIDVDSALRAGWQVDPSAVHPVHARWFTGKVLVRCDTSEGAWCLAGSPVAYRDRVATGAGHQARLIEAGCSVIPAIRATVNGCLVHEEAGHVWTLTRWIDGSLEDDHKLWNASMLEDLGGAVGELHRLGRQVLAEGAAAQPVPEQVWACDWRGFDRWAEARWDRLMGDAEVAGALELDPLRDAIRLGLDALPTLQAPLVRNLTVAHDDLWTEHVLFDAGGRLAAIIDLDGLDAGDGHGDFAALLSDFANLEPRRCGHVVRGYRTQCEVSADDLAAARTTTIRHHLLTLMERIRLWQEHHDRREDLISPTRYWQRSIRTAVELDTEHWVAATLEAAQP